VVGFGDALKRFREDRGLSLRELDKLSGVNYAYIQRLESNEKIAPSDEKIDALCGALKLSAQRRELLRVLLNNPPVPDALFEAMFQHGLATVDALVIASRVSFRGKRPTTALEWIEKLDDIDINVLGNRAQ
jgi:transcriptional regulator with XRE-family HTH domain